jgi:hypothetical protein
LGWRDAGRREGEREREKEAPELAGLLSLVLPNVDNRIPHPTLFDNARTRSFGCITIDLSSSSFWSSFHHLSTTRTLVRSSQSARHLPLRPSTDRICSSLPCLLQCPLQLLPLPSDVLQRARKCSNRTPHPQERQVRRREGAYLQSEDRVLDRRTGCTYRWGDHLKASMGVRLPDEGRKGGQKEAGGGVGRSFPDFRLFWSW